MTNRYCLLLSTIAFLSVIQSAEAQIVPDGTTATQVNGNAIAPTGAGTINGGNLYNSFNQFNVPQSGVIFNTGNSAVNGADVRNIINRVTGDNPSAILGTIESRQAFPNANLYLMNPNGIVFGQNARLDIGGSFHATTGTGLGFDSGTFQVDKNSLSFPSGDPKTIRFAISQPAGLINQGDLSVDTGKTITFTGGSIINTGILTAPSGNVALIAVAGNSQVELRSPDAVLGLQVTANAVPTQWNGKITELPQLAELLTGKVAQADRVVVKADGSLALVANPALTDIAVTNGMAIVSGLVDVSSDVAKGGNVGIFGNQVGLVNAQINASGKTGGGTVLIGGDFQGEGIAPNALQTYVSSSSSILANSLFTGNGGKVIVWADDFTRFLGAISAKGGDISGDGGFVEVSGKQNLDFRGQVSTLAPKGVTGSLLLDPTDITISPSTFTSGGSFVGGIFVPSASVADISASTLLSLLTSSNVTISTASTFAAPLGGTITVNNDLSWSGGTTPNTSLTLIADNNIVINAAINVLGNGNFTATATNNINVNGSSLTTHAGTLTLTATNGDIQIPSTTTLGSSTTGNIIFTAGNGISLGGQVLSTSGGFIELVAGNGGIASTATNGINSTAPSGNSGRISIDTTGSLAVTNGIISSSSIGNGGDILIGSTQTPTSVNIGSLSSFANGTTGNGGNVTINAVGNIQTTGTTNAIASFAANSGNGGNVSLTSSNGAIDVSSGVVRTSSTNGTSGDMSFTTTGDITTQLLDTSNLTIGNAGNISLQSTNGNITISAINASSVSSSSGNAGNVTIQAIGDIKTAGNVLIGGQNYAIASFATGNGGNVSLTSTNGAIDVSSGTVSSASISVNGGNINFIAKNSITAADLNTSSDLASGGNIFLDPIGDIVLNSANTAGSVQGGNFTAISTGGNIKLLGLVSSPFATCAGASICTASNSANTGGQISIQHGGINSFTIGDSSINGTAGIITTGSSTLALGTILPVGNSSFTQGNVIISPYAIPSNPTVSPPLVDKVFTPPVPIGNLLAVDADTLALLEIREVMKKEVDRFLKEDNLSKAYDAIEKAYISELGIFLGDDLKPPAVSINQAQEILSDVSKRSGSVSALIYPIMLNNRIEVLVIPPKELGKPFHRYTNYANEDEIVNVLMEYRANLRDPDSQDYLVQSKKLYDWVMRPIDAQLQAMKIETVIFAMDSGLRVIPPAALYDGKQFLIERYASANIPSLRVTRLEDRDRKNTRVLAMGLTEARGELSALPSVEVEIRTIGTQVLSGTTFLNQDFTVDKLQEERGKANYGILHLATHGQFLQDRAKDSYIQFWDSKLRSDQIPKLRFDQPVIDMLTLSACETAVGNNLGISGLAVESGARSILASLWTVSDVGTTPLMISFYKAFPNALSKATALRQAQLELLKGKVKIENNQIVGVEGLAAIALPKGNENIDLRHPFFWSSFILVGNWL